MITWNFLLTSFVVVLIPGTGALFTISTGLVHGRRASLFAALGCTAGIVPHLAATIAGLAAVLHVSALAFNALKWAGVAYLFYLALLTWRDRATFALDQPASELKPSGIVSRAFLLNILNPKLSVFFLAFLPQFVPTHTGAPVLALLTLSGIFMAMTFVVFAVYGVLAHAFRQAVLASPRVQAWMRRGFAGAFAGLGAQLAMSER